MIEYGPDKMPEIPSELVQTALALRMQVITVFCTKKELIRDDPGSVSFVAMVSSIPRIGEVLTLEDGRRCLVKLVNWDVRVGHGETGKAKLITLAPTVLAVDFHGDGSDPQA